MINGVQIEEIVNFVVSLLFLIYLPYLMKGSYRSIRSFWFFSVLLLFSSQVFTVLEGFFYEEILNILEHIFFASGCFLFLMSVIRREFYN